MGLLNLNPGLLTAITLAAAVALAPQFGEDYSNLTYRKNVPYPLEAVNLGCTCRWVV